jgi:hypothetical protein
MALRFDRSNNMLSFRANSAELAFLGPGWTSPGGTFPWSLQPFGRIELPYGLGWEKAAQITLHGLLFIPPSTRGIRRRVSIHFGQTLVFDKIFENDTENDAIPLSLQCPVPPQFGALARDLEITLSTEAIGSPKALGLTDDDREIGFALELASLDFPDRDRIT